MNKNSLVIIMSFIGSLSFSQEVKTLKTVEITFYNNSIFPRKVSLISYSPDEKGNGTYVQTFLPYSRIKKKFKAGTQLYLANQQEVDIVMSGSKLTGKPFKVIKEEDDKTTVKLNN